MTKTNMDLSELLAKHDQGDFLRGIAEAVLQLIMETDVEGIIGVPPLKWSTHWDMTIPLFGGPEDGWKAREAGRHCFEASAG